MQKKNIADKNTCGPSISQCSLYYFKIKKYSCPGWYGSVDWVLACKPKGHWFNSHSGHMPGLQARYPVGSVQEATDLCFSPSLSSSLPPL